MRESFASLYGRPPTHAARAPGRVNLIGEHVDYHDLPVLPFAIERAVTVLFAPAPDAHASRVRFASASAGLPDDEFRLDAPIEPLAAGDWRNYPRAACAELAAGDTSIGRAAQGLAPDPGREGGRDGGRQAPRGIDALVVSDLPMAAGLSSSSALVVGVGLAIGHASGAEVDRLSLAGAMARAERFVGTRGGGMDQAACLLSRAGCISRISFAPLRVEHIPFPGDLSLLVATSGEVADKSGRIREAYNERRRAGEDALATVSVAAGLREASFAALLGALGEARALRLAERILPADGSDPRRRHERFRHVVTEAGRVGAAEQALRRGDGPSLGSLLDASHASLRDDYEVSTAALDELVGAARSAGALGARLTGAGFGGAIVALVHARDEALVEGALAAAGGRVWTVRPADGAEVRTL